MLRRFKGSLANYRLPLLVPALCQGEDVSGRLRVRRGPKERAFYLDHGRLVAESSTDPQEHFAQQLVDRRLVDLRQVVEAFERSRAKGIPLGEFLVETNVVPSQLVRQVLVEKARDALVDCYSWESGELAWQPARRQVQPVALSIDLPLKQVHLDAVALWKEWRGFVSAFPDSTVRLRALGSPSSASPEELHLWERVAAGATVEELVGHSGHRLVAARLLVRLLRKGDIAVDSPQAVSEARSVPVEEMLKNARELIDQRQFERAAEVAARALEQMPVPEAQALYALAEGKLRGAALAEMRRLENELDLVPLQELKLDRLTAADVMLYANLQREGSMQRALRQTPLPVLPAYFSVKRLMAAGLVRRRSG